MKLKRSTLILYFFYWEYPTNLRVLIFPYSYKYKGLGYRPYIPYIPCRPNFNKLGPGRKI